MPPIAVPKTAEILTLPLPAEGLTANQYRDLEKILKDWEEQVRQNASRFPRRSYDLGVEQTMAFMRMLGLVGQTDLPPAGLIGPTKKAAVAWQKTYTLMEIDGALAKYLDDIKSHVLWGLQGTYNPTAVAAELYKATKDASVNWRTVARTEMVRANAAGRLDAIEAMGYTEVWAPRHTGACGHCRRLLEGRTFSIDEVRNISNFNRPMHDWVACIPLHPHCRHVWLAYVPDVFDQAQSEYQTLDDNGLDDKTLNEMFDSSGQLKPQYENDPRLAAYFEQTDKSHDPLMFALQTAIEKTRREEPPGLHHTSARRNCASCQFYERPDCGRFNWPVDRDEVCGVWEAKDTVGKGFFDNPQISLDPLLWTTAETLRPDVRDRIVGWWRNTFTADAPLWSHLYIVGSAASRAWAGRKTAGDVDVHVVVDWPAFRKHHPEYGALSDPEIHAALVTAAKAAKEDVEVAPGLALDIYIRDEPTSDNFEAFASTLGQGVWDVSRGRWVTVPPREPTVEDLTGGEILEGEGGSLALKHPDWLKTARRLRDAMTAALTDPDVGELRDVYEYVHDLRDRGFHGGDGADSLGAFVWRYLMDFGPLARVKHLLHPTPLEKVFPLYRITDLEVAKAQPAASGTEHWITVHPHGEDEKGIPVLVRENGDGSATVIGGGGGHLDFLRITGKGRMKDPAKPKDRGTVDQAESPEDAQAREDVAEKAHQAKAAAQADFQDSRGRVEDLVRDVVNKQGVVLGENTVGWDDLSATQRKELVKNAMGDSLYQSTYGNMTDRNRAEAPSGPIVLQAPPKEPSEKGDPADTASRDTSGSEDTPSTATRHRMRIPMPADIANQIQEEQYAMSVHRKRVIEANRAINKEGAPVDATSLDWEPIDKPAGASKVAALKLQQDTNRELLGMVDQKRQEENSYVSHALRKGAFQAFDSLTSQLLGGKTQLNTAATDLLGVNGTAQLVAHVLQEHARAGKLDIKQVMSTIDEVTDERQKQVTDINLNRAKLAAAEITEMSKIVSAYKRGESTGLRTGTNAAARLSNKTREAAESLGMAISGSEALHTLRSILQQPMGKIEVGGFASPGQIKDRAVGSKIKIHDSDIVRHGPGDYSLKLSAENLAGLLDRKPDSDRDLKDQLMKIRSGQDMDNEIKAAQNPPGYARTLDPAQAKGSLFLRAAGSGILAFAPGVGKTDTALAAAMEKMAAEPEKNHRVLIVAPPTALAGAWASTIQKACPGKTLQILGHNDPAADPETGAQDWGQKAGRSTGKRLAAQKSGESAADFNIIGFDTLSQNPEFVKNLGHTIMVVDEMQYAKNPNTARNSGITKAAEGVDNRWALTGTPIEKRIDDLHTMLDFARPGEHGSIGQFHTRYGEGSKGDQLDQYSHLSAEEKVQAFRDATGSGLYYQGQDATHMPPKPELKIEHTPITDGHAQMIADSAEAYNAVRREVKDARDRIAAGEPDVKVPALPQFGGRAAQIEALMKPEKRGYLGPNNRATKVADLIAQNPQVEFPGFHGHSSHADGSHAGSYAPKSIVFNRQTQPLASIKDEIEKRGTHKVFYTHGSVPGGNDKVLAAFMAHDGPAVLLTSDTNKTARSLQFGDNSNSFQHGATQVIHTDLPENNADLEQRVARAWRRGAQMPVTQHLIHSDTPVENQALETLQSEIKTQKAVGNPEDKVGGKETVGQKVTRKRGGKTNG